MLSTTLFHAMAELGHEALIICEPADLYVSLGYFDRANELIDLNKCRELNIGVIRRQTGGGAVLLGPGQVFYQLLISKSRVPFRVSDAYRKLSEPVIRTYGRLGLEVEYRPVNDLLAKRSQRKVSGQGAGDIGKVFVFVGNILLEFDPDLMAELFALRDEAKREEIRKSLWENMGWLKRETGKTFTFEQVAQILLEEFSKEFELKIHSSPPEEALELAQELKKLMTSEETILEDTGRKHDAIKIREGVYVSRG